MPYRSKSDQNAYRREWYRRNSEKEIERISGIRSRLRNKMTGIRINDDEDLKVEFDES
jgi:hypothetical protein